MEQDGSLAEGAEAVFRTLAHGGKTRLLWAYRHLAPLRAAADWTYAVVASHRPFFSRLTRWLVGTSIRRPSTLLTRWVYLRCLGIIFLIAFASFGVQWKGLIGERGILPAGKLMEAVAGALGPQRYTAYPTLLWLAPGDESIALLCLAGAVLSCLLILDFAPGPILLLLWTAYLSLMTVGGDFLQFQWDILLLETGFLSAFFAPWKLLPGLHRDTRPPRAALWLLRFLLFRLMFASGVVKLASGDPAWWGLSALRMHYETQPLPTAIGWYAHQLPAAFQRFSAAVMFLIELGLPFLIFLPRRPRLLAFAGFGLLQLAIALTGNYCFFNLLTMTLCLLLLDDTLLVRFFPPGMRAQSEAPRALGWRVFVRAPVIALLVAAILPLEFMALSRCARRSFPWPETLRAAERAVFPFRTVGSYGLFARMTTQRNEIVVEGSNDGSRWEAYEFKWKPGDLRRAPGWVQPHQPRLDWQMWFAALGTVRDNLWFQNFMVRILQGSQDVLVLLEKNPFPAGPPRYVRALLYRYRFTDAGQRRRDGTWWRREPGGIYCPPVSLRSP